MKRKLWRAAVFTGATLAGYALVVRPWHLRWGATAAEVGRPLPGDELVPHPNLVATRAITIVAPPRAIWPWLVQMGYGRAGWYSYDWIDNNNVHVDTIIPSLQQLKVGDTMLTAPNGGFRVEALEPERTLALLIRGADVGARLDISSVIVLEPLDAERTRLILRLRGAFRGLRERLWLLLFEPGDFVMMRKMLLGIKRRAEQRER
jgi:hypothetical protein